MNWFRVFGVSFFYQPSPYTLIKHNIKETSSEQKSGVHFINPKLRDWVVTKEEENCSLNWKCVYIILNKDNAYMNVSLWWYQIATFRFSRDPTNTTRIALVQSFTVCGAGLYEECNAPMVNLNDYNFEPLNRKLFPYS